MLLTGCADLKYSKMKIVLVLLYFQAEVVKNVPCKGVQYYITATGIWKLNTSSVNPDTTGYSLALATIIQFKCHSISGHPAVLHFLLVTEA